MIARRALLARIAGLLAAIAGLGAPAAGAPADHAPITVFAAASLTDALQAVGGAYTARTGTPVRFSFASSSVVARQIEAGAGADLFFSADIEWMDYLQKRGLIDAPTRHDLLRGRLALIAPAEGARPIRIGRHFPLAAALGARGRLAVGDPDYVPAGRYARAALVALGVWPAVRERLARADNVRVALSYVARREAPLGIVYETDARVEPGVRVVGLFPETSHPPIVYPLALTRGAAPGARGFYDFARGAEARAIFRRFGYRTIG